VSGVTKTIERSACVDGLDDEPMRIALLRIGSSVAAVVWAGFAALAWSSGATSCALAMLVCSAATSLGPLVGRLAGSGVGGSYFVSLLIGGLTLTSVVRGGVEASVAQWFGIVPLISVLGARPRKAWLWGVLSVLALAALVIAEQQHWLGARATASRFGPALSSAALLGAIALLGAFFHRCRAQAFDRYASLQRELFQSQQLDGLGRLAGGIAHDFNNLLSVVSTRAELASSPSTTQAERDQDLEAIRAAAEQGVALTRDLVAFAGGNDGGSAESLQVRGVVRDVSRLLGRVLPRTIRLDLQLDSTAGQVMASHRRLHQVLMNLVLNAKEAMPDGGTIVIAVDAFKGRPPGASPRAHAVGEYVRIRVADEGTGMTEHTRRRVLEPFFTTKSRGTGLGLATVHRIVRDYGGVLDVQSTPGEGSIFDVYLAALPTDVAAVRGHG
jgi:signal transduction histidine kinase